MEYFLKDNAHRRSLGILIRGRRGVHPDHWMVLLNDVRSVTCEWIFCAGLGRI